jgi:hypothetical protein
VDTDAEGKGTDGPDRDPELLVSWAEVSQASLMAELAAACARYRVVITLSFVPPDPEQASG